ncbi:MAG: tripartite tricarboxylate transporter substrate binding protein [Alphaproteobacteria bacterium]|nr:tripartite tricarboxylate transporter substrate binding protein [Alphaproteobacteria bacterium]
MRLVRAWLAVLALAASVPAVAETYPNRPVKLVVGFAAGGGADNGSRLFAHALGERWGQQIVIDNRGGAGGMLAAEIVANAPPDGYTLLACSINQALAPLLYKKLTVDPVKDFAPITATSVLANILMVNNASPFKTLGELLAYAKANPGKLTYGSSGVGASLHITMEMLKSMAGVDIVHVPYKGGAPALADLLAGHIDMVFGNATDRVASIKAGQMRALAVSSAKRIPMLPDVPTVAEQGVPGFEVITWYGLCAPAATPEPILAKLSADAIAAQDNEEYKRRCFEYGVEPAPMSRAEYAAFVDTQAAKWAKVMREVHIEPQ